MDDITILWKALSSFQSEGGFVKATAENPFHKSKYAPLKDIVMKTRPILDKHGLQVVQKLTNIDGKGAIETMLIHLESGQHVEGIAPLVHKDNDPQAQGSAITYGRRYGYVTILGLLVDADDDGNLANSVGPVADKKQQAADFYAEKAKMIRTLREKGLVLDQVGALVQVTLGKPRIETLEEIDKVLAAAEAQ